MDTLIPLKLPPGMRNNGTAYQSKDRWYSGNFVRFFQDTIQPIGGWSKRTLSGTTITGTVSAAHSWMDSSGVTWIAVGTTAALYVINNATNVVSDITNPVVAAFLPSSNCVWSLDNFGGWLVSVAAHKDSGTVLASGAVPCVWKNNPAVKSVQCDDVYTSGAAWTANSAYNMSAVVATPERFLMVLNGFPMGSGMEPTLYANG